MEIYLDNAATTRCDDEVVALMEQVLRTDYGNPSSAHRKGFVAEQYLRCASEQIAKSLHCRKEELIFTSGGTEADNLAVFGAAYARRRRGRRILTTAIEHPAVFESVKALRDAEFEVVFLPVDEKGLVTEEALCEALTPDTILVSVMAVNNETGTIEPIENIGRLVRERSPEALFHTDAVQAFGKIPLSVKSTDIDLLSISAHKIGGPKGTGCLYVRSGVQIKPLMFGGGQQRGLRSGTEYVPGIAGFGLAAERALAGMEEEEKRLRTLRRRLLQTICTRIPDVVIAGASSPEDDAQVVPHIMSVAFRGVRAEVLLHALEERDIYVSNGSACASHHPETSRTLQAIGWGEDLLSSAIRLSFSRHTTEEEIDAVCAALEELIPMLRKFQRT